jgi:hypothetical protein
VLGAIVIKRGYRKDKKAGRKLTQMDFKATAHISWSRILVID